MSARTLTLGLAALLCALSGVLAVGAGSAGAAASKFGELGEGAGQLGVPIGVAVNNDLSSASAGDVYVTSHAINRVNRFSGSGAFQLAWGWGVANGGNETQTCGPQATPPTDTCQGAKETETAGAATYPTGVAVDNDPLSASAGDVYVVQAGGGMNRVEKFGAAGEFVLMFGGDVNETTGGDVCIAGEKCKRGVVGSADGQFDFQSFGNVGNSIAVGPGGRVYVGDSTPRIQVFEPSGKWLETISLAGLASKGVVSGLAVDEAGDMFVRYGPTELEENGVGLGSGESAGGVSGVRELEPDGTERSTQFDAGSRSVTGVALNGAGDLFVGDSKGGFHVLKYAIATGKVVASFGSNTVGEPYYGTGNNTGMAFSEALGDLYVSEFSDPKVKNQAEEHTSASVWILSPPPPGPAIERVSAMPGPRGGEATLAGTINPEASETEYHFDYVTEAEFKQNGFTGGGVVSTPAGSLAESTEPKSVAVRIKGLPPSTDYRYRLVAGNVEGAPSPVEGTFETLPPAYLESEFATDVSSSSATLNANVNPLGVSTAYRLEYGLSTTYGQMVAGSVGEGVGDVLVSVHRQELSPGTTYHFRIVVHNSFGTVEGADHTFTTQTAGEEPTLPDGRAWELVSPVRKGAALIQPLNADDIMIQAAAGGGAIAYEATDAIGEDPLGKANISEVLSTRGPAGWQSQDVSIPRNLPPEGTSALDAEGGQAYTLFSQNLSLGVVEQAGLAGSSSVSDRPLSSEATERTPYLRNDSRCESGSEGCYTPLVSPLDVEPSSLRFGGKNPGTELSVVGGSPDLGHLVLQSPYALTAGAVSEVGKIVGAENLYEWGEGKLQLVNVPPGAKSSAPGAYLGYQGLEEDVVAHSVSNDGRFVVWSVGDQAADGLFVRNMVEKRTVKVGGPGADFQTMSGAGLRVFYREDGELYELNAETGASMDITASHGAGEADAGVQDAILGSGEDGSYVYFVATGVLADGAAHGGDNLYMAHDGAGGWSTTYIATLSSEDEHSWYANGEIAEEKSPCDCGGVERNQVSSRVSPNGMFVAFMSDRPLTGYDNHDAVSGQLDEEVFLYDALTRRLVCVSCDPTGARPVGVLDGARRLLVDPEDAWGARGEESTEAGHWLAGMIPSSWAVKIAQGNGGDAAFYQPRYLSDSGRLFFESSDGLVPHATNGLMDVYEYEPLASGETAPSDNCTVASPTFGERSVGCVSLISGGTSGSESMFYDASESGDDVFFITTSELVPADNEMSYALFDARVCSTEAPCVTESVSPPACTSGDSCKAAPSPQPEIFGAPPSATFAGAGNLVPSTPIVKSTKKTAKCPRGKSRNKSGKCVKRKAKARKAGKRKAKARNAGKAGRANNDRRARS